MAQQPKINEVQCKFVIIISPSNRDGGWGNSEKLRHLKRNVYYFHKSYVPQNNFCGGLLPPYGFSSPYNICVIRDLKRQRAYPIVSHHVHTHPYFQLLFAKIFIGISSVFSNSVFFWSHSADAMNGTFLIMVSSYGNFITKDFIVTLFQNAPANGF